MPARTGNQYIESLRDGREVWLNGERVEDVPTHPAFRGAVQSMAALYDLQHQDDLRDVMTYASPTTGDPVNRAFMMPKSHEDLVARRRMMEVWARYYCGMMSRSPDSIALATVGFAAAREFFGGGGDEYGRNAWALYENARENDLCFATTFHDPQVDRSRSASEQPEENIALTAVEETSEGVIVSGARQLATSSALCDELINFPIHQVRDDEPQHALIFIIPAATPGLRMICREPLNPNNNQFDHPLASRFEEMDAVIVFDEVLVPWERFLCYRNVKINNAAPRMTKFRALNLHQVMTRDLVKAEFLLGLGHLIAESIGVNGFLHVQEKLGELVSYVEVIRGCLLGAEATPVEGPGGILHCSEGPIRAMQLLFTSIYPRMVEILQLIGAGGLLTTPTEAEVRGPRAADIQKFFQGRAISGPDRVQLFKLAWDVVGDGFGSRQVFFERFFAGDPVRGTARQYNDYDTSQAVGLVKTLLGWKEEKKG